MFSSLISPLPRSKPPHLNPLVTGNGTTVSISEFLPLTRNHGSSPAPSTHAMRQFISAEKSAPTNKSFSGEKKKANTFTVSSAEDPLQDLLSVEEKAEEEEEEEEEEAFFRNMYSYLDDCERHKRGPSPFQALLFMTATDTPLAQPAIQRCLSRMIGFFGGVVTGEWLPALKKRYPEYLDGVELDELEGIEEMSEK